MKIQDCRYGMSSQRVELPCGYYYGHYAGIKNALFIKTYNAMVKADDPSQTWTNDSINSTASLVRVHGVIRIEKNA